MSDAFRYGGGLNLNPHFHTLVPGEVYREGPTSETRFSRAPSPTRAQTRRMPQKTQAKLRSQFERRGYGMARRADRKSMSGSLLSVAVDGEVIRTNRGPFIG